MNDVVTFPAIPFWHAIQGTLEPGKMIEIRGTVPYGADCFQVNFTDAMDAGSHHADRILHISVRFNGRIAVLNSLAYGSWENEERSSDFPFASGQQFVMLILVEPASYKIAVNGQHRWEFPHRHAMDRVKMLNIDGTVRIEEVRIFGRHIPPPQPVGTCFIPDGSGQGLPFSQTITNPPLPFFHQFDDGLKVGMQINIHGRPTAAARRFNINFQCSSVPYPPPDIAFHFDVRMHNNTVIRNSRVNNEWQREESYGPIFPFQHGVYYDMLVRVDADCFHVAVNGVPFTRFEHRLFPLSRINTLSIEEDAVLSAVQVQYR